MRAHFGDARGVERGQSGVDSANKILSVGSCNLLGVRTMTTAMVLRLFYGISVGIKRAHWSRNRINLTVGYSGLAL